jgi:hypothetical protein
VSKRVITVHRLSLQFDTYQVIGNNRQQAMDVVDIINGVLQREPYGLAAQLIANRDEIEVEVQEEEEN